MFHFFIKCPAYTIARQTLLNNLQNIFGIDTTNYTNVINTVLEGHQVHPRHFAELLLFVSDYLSDTNRFR